MDISESLARSLSLEELADRLESHHEFAVRELARRVLEDHVDCGQQEDFEDA